MVVKSFFVMAIRNQYFTIYLFFSILFLSHLCMGGIKENIRSDRDKSKASSIDKKKSVVRPKLGNESKDSLSLRDYPKSLERNALLKAGDKINISYATLENASKNSIHKRSATHISKTSLGKSSVKKGHIQSNSQIPAWLAKLNKKENKSEKKADVAQIKGIEFISFIINQHNSEIQDCYHDYLKISPDVRGRMVVRIIVNGKGNVDDVVIKESDIQDDIFKNRIIKIIKQWGDLGQGNFENRIYLQEYVFGE